MNVYDQAHQLAAAIKESGEGKEMAQIVEKINGIPDVKNILKDLESKQAELQQAILGGDMSKAQSMQADLEKFSAIMAANPVVMEYLQSSMRMATMINDVQKIIMDAIPSIAK